MSRAALCAAVLFVAPACDGSGAPSGDAVAAPTPAPRTLPEPPVGQKAPDFALRDLDGNEVRLSSFLGRPVVLEWFNPGCPFVRYAHSDAGPLRAQPARAAAAGAAWLAVNSGAPGHEGHGADVNRKAREDWAMDYPVLLDESGDVGHLYGARATPGIFVVDAQGTLAYAGALDNRPQGQGEGDAVNWVDAALADLAAGRPVATPRTDPYGCSVKYDH